MESVELQNKIKAQEAEISELKRKLSDRNPAFNGNLLRKADQAFNEITYAIGSSIHNCLDRELVNAFSNIPMIFRYESSYVGTGKYVVHIDKAHAEAIKDKIADWQMSKFQSSLDNFAWAVQNHGV